MLAKACPEKVLASKMFYILIHLGYSGNLHCTLLAIGCFRNMIKRCECSILMTKDPKYLLKLLVDLLSRGNVNSILLSLKTIEIYFRQLDLRHNDYKVLREFNDLGGIDTIERLQLHPNRKIYSYSIRILEKHIGVENN